MQLGLSGKIASTICFVLKLCSDDLSYLGANTLPITGFGYYAT